MRATNAAICMRKHTFHEKHWPAISETGVCVSVYFCVHFCYNKSKPCGGECSDENRFRKTGYHPAIVARGSGEILSNTLRQLLEEI